MIAFARTIPTREERFLQMLPQIREQARHAFRNEHSERREEVLAEVIANCWVAFVRLMDRGLDDVIYPTPLAQYAIRQVRDGRRVGSKMNVHDVSSGYAQRRKSFVLKTLDLFDDAKQEWKEVLVEDKHAGPADTAASRLDFDAWLRLLPRRLRRIAETLATGETTKKTAKRFHVSPGRISQLRRELNQNWQDFQGGAAFASDSVEPPVAARAAEQGPLAWLGYSPIRKQTPCSSAFLSPPPSPPSPRTSPMFFRTQWRRWLLRHSPADPSLPRAPILVLVEGPHDIEFLCRISERDPVASGVRRAQPGPNGASPAAGLHPVRRRRSFALDHATGGTPSAGVSPVRP